MSTAEVTLFNGVPNKAWHGSWSKLVFKLLEVLEHWISLFSCLTLGELSSNSGNYNPCLQSWNQHTVADTIVVEWCSFLHSYWNLLSRWVFWEVAGQEASCSVTGLFLTKRACGRGSFSSPAVQGHCSSMGDAASSTLLEAESSPPQTPDLLLPWSWTSRFQNNKGYISL